MGEERKTRKKSGCGVEGPSEGISSQLRGILEQGAQEGEIEAGIDAAIEEKIVVTREEILRLYRSQPQRGSRNKKSPPKK